MLNTESQEEYAKLVEIVKKQLTKVRDPQTGKPVVKEIFHRDEIYHGPYLNQAPDIIMLLEEGYKATTTLSGTKIIEDVSILQGTHEREGIFIAAGPTIVQNIKIDEIHIQDLAPTILHLMQVRIPDNVDGKVRKELFKKNSAPFINEPQYFKSKIEIRRPKPLSLSDEEKIKARLRNLGYLD